MEIALIVTNIVLTALCLVLVLLVWAKSKNTNTPARHTDDGELREAIRRLEEKTETLTGFADFNARSVENLSRSTETRLTNIQNRLTDDMKYIVDANAQNLERIRRTVDDKLTSSIDGKLSDSFSRISDRLEKMYVSVGEMKSLSGNVADIKRVFSNVKLRGTWGEAQLNALLEQMLAPDQYERSVKLNPLDNSLADFAIKMPSRDGNTVYLPVDSKLPVEEFERLCEASERGDKEAEEQARKGLERAVKLQADSIAKKYILPPVTTDFAVMYLPSEGLFAEVVRMSGLADYLQRRRIFACGPSNLGALLSTLQTGFRTAAIEKRSGELRQMLDSFRADFAKFSELLEKTRRKLQEATDSVESAEKRTNTIGRKLNGFRAIGSPDDDNDE
ncbi:MAG: DNA recombination protein RmuC [Clostridia bacterium]|nr:DNA recombination protein RmuC [Clostridia bacterium]